MRAHELDTLLRRLLESSEGASDLNFTPGKPPQVEVNGDLSFPFIEPPLPELTPWMTEQIALNLLDHREDLIRELLATGAADCAYEVPGLARFRVNIFTQRGRFSIVLRRLATTIPTIHDLVLPLVFQQMATYHKGLVLVTGATGQGKSTTMAALIHEINLTRPVHIVSLEDPIEFTHKHQIGTVNQRELGVDFDSWPNGLRAALRQAPKVIVLGELRDRETMETALHAAETGHLVLGTLHTMGAGQTINRLVGMFPTPDQPRLRARLADALKNVVAQWLVPRKEGGRIAVLEILASTLRTQELIREGESEHKTFYRALFEGRNDSMQTFDQHLIDLLADDFIDEDTVRHYAHDKVWTSQQIDRVAHDRAAEQGEAVPEPEGFGDLQVDFSYGRQPPPPRPQPRGGRRGR